MSRRTGVEVLLGKRMSSDTTAVVLVAWLIICL